MKVLAVALLAVLAVSVQARKLDDILGKIMPSFATPFVINGTDADPHAAPYIVSLGSKFSKHAHSCGGTIISKEWIVTAGHCISTAEGMSAMAGLHVRSDVDDVVQHREIDFGRVHKDFGGGVGPYDIALLHVSEPFEFNEYIQPAALPVRSELHEGESHLYGWGQSKAYVLTAAKTLQTMTTRVLEWELCRDTLPENSPLHLTNLCSDSLQEGKSACNGDSGGPLVVESPNAASELIGIVSWGYIPCGKSNMPSIFTRVSAYIDWITEVQNAYYTLF